MKIFLLYILIISAISVIVTVLDKKCAEHGLWRISEKTLLTLAFLGGANAMYVTMLFIRHKTKKKKFTVLLPIFCLVQIGIIIYMFRLTNKI